ELAATISSPYKQFGVAREKIGFLRGVVVARVLLQHDVEVRPSETEGAQPGAAVRVRIVGEARPLVGIFIELGALAIDLFVRVLHTDRRCQNLLSQRESGFD